MPSAGGDTRLAQDFDQLPGWSDDDLQPALGAFRRNPRDELAAAAREADCARGFFERWFVPAATVPGHFTGYFEPELDGSLTPTAACPVPIHGLPPGGISLPRAEIEPHLRGHEIAWVRDEADRFSLQVQGSGRLRLADGRRVRIAYAGKNGHPYRSIGRLLVERGIFGPDITAEALMAWLRADPARGRAAMNENPSYVMFKVVGGAAIDGPQGTLCRVTEGRSLAVDPRHTPLGTPVWIEVDGMARLCIAQDTGSAIQGPGRADLFFGTGAAAGAKAGRLNRKGRFTPLLRR